MEKLTYYFDKQLFTVDVVRSTNKNMYLKVKNNKVICSAPKKFSQKEVKAFVDENAKKFYEYIKKSKKNELYSLINDFIFIDGIKYKINRLIGLSKSKVELHKNSIDVYTKDNEDESVDKVLKQLLKIKTTKYIELNQKRFEKAMEVPSHETRVVYKTTTWGTNMVNKKKISYSSRLAHFNDEIKDYLIVHELAHHHEPNHSKDFWKLVSKFCPKYKELQKQLKRNEEVKE